MPYFVAMISEIKMASFWFDVSLSFLSTHDLEDVLGNSRLVFAGLFRMFRLWGITLWGITISPMGYYTLWRTSDATYRHTTSLYSSKKG